MLDSSKKSGKTIIISAIAHQSALKFTTANRTFSCFGLLKIKIAEKFQIKEMKVLIIFIANVLTVRKCYFKY